MSRRWAKPVWVVLASAAVIAGVIYAGYLFRQWLDRQGHYLVAIADIECPVPPGLARNQFLAEVQYLAGLPDRISSNDPSAVLKLNAAFRGHPWVEHVDSVALRTPDGPKAVLRIRTPVLAVHGRAVDSKGVLLPTEAPLAGLLAFRGSSAEPKGPAGTPWGDETIEGAARAAAALAPFRDRLKLKEVSPVADGLVFQGDVTIDWGSLGDIGPKIERLSEMLKKPDPLPKRIDLGK
jgi:hypothetical protein